MPAVCDGIICLSARVKIVSRFSWFSWFLLLVALSCCVCGLELNVTHRSYQAEEKQNVTLDWTFRPEPDPSLKRLFVFCEVITINRTNPVLFLLHDGVEIPLRDEEFSGRVQCDKDVLKEGRIRLHVSSLRTEDSGRYTCEVKSEYGVNLDSCELNVTAARTQTHSDTGPTRTQVNSTTGPEEPDSGGRGWIGLYCALGLTAVGLIVFCVLIILPRLNKLNIKSEETDPDESLAQSLRTSALCSQSVFNSVSEVL